MPAIAWTLTIAGVTQTLAAWDIVDIRASFRSLDDDELILTLRGDVFAACPLAFGQLADLARGTVHYFQGTVTDIRAEGTDRLSGWTITISNAWWQLKRTMFQQPMASYTTDGSCTLIGSVQTTKVVLFQDNISGAALTTGQQLQAVVTYALLSGIPLALGSAPAFVNVPFESARDLTLADVIRRCLQATPDAVSWFDYSGGTPVINFQQRALLPAVALDFTSAPATIEQFTLRPRRDLIPTGVRFAYISPGQCPGTIAAGCVDPSTGITNTSGAPVASPELTQVSKIVLDDSGLPNQPGGLIGTIDLSPAPGALGVGSNEAAPIGLAAQYYLSLLTPQWEGSVTTREQECSGALRPGKVLNLANGNADWAAMNALVQEVHESLLSGQTVITVGPANHLGPQDFVSLIQFARRRPFATNAFPATRPSGTPAAPNCAAGQDPNAKILRDWLAANAAAAAQALAAKMAAALVNGTGGAGAPNGPMSTVPLDLCDPPGSTVTVYAPR